MDGIGDDDQVGAAALILPAVVRTRPPRRWLFYTLVVGVVVVAIAGPLLWLGGPYAVASFRSVAARSSYQTVWALIDGNLGTGLLGRGLNEWLWVTVLLRTGLFVLLAVELWRRVRV